jgi:branched-subunit amino acid transport protein
MSTLLPILGMGLGMYALRLGGMVLRDVTVPPAWERALRFVPVALLTALVLVSILGRAGDERFFRLIGAAGGALVAWRTKKMWACILAGMAIYWILRSALP